VGGDWSSSESPLGGGLVPSGQPTPLYKENMMFGYELTEDDEDMNYDNVLDAVRESGFGYTEYQPPVNTNTTNRMARELQVYADQNRPPGRVSEVSEKRKGSTFTVTRNGKTFRVYVTEEK
jgi:hypothetical protein